MDEHASLVVSRFITRLQWALLLFAVGVVTGTILSFEFGLLWPNFMATYGEVFGLGFTLEGISFFVEGIFIAIYVYGWDRMSKTAHFLSGIPIAIAGVVGSLMVIAVNAWMNKPGGFTQVDGRVDGRGGRRSHPVEHNRRGRNHKCRCHPSRLWVFIGKRRIFENL